MLICIISSQNHTFPDGWSLGNVEIEQKRIRQNVFFWSDFLSRPQKHHIDRNITHKIHWLEPRQTLINSFDKYWHLILSWTIFKLRQGASITCFVCRSVGRSVCPKNVYLQYFNILLQMSNYTGAYCFPSLFIRKADFGKC